jgi:PIN domain nuclease of toxin-antitoxin system
VRLVTDTHALVWYVSGEHRRLSRRAHAVFRQAEEGRSTVIIPTVVLFELTLLERIGRIRVAATKEANRHHPRSSAPPPSL